MTDDKTTTLMVREWLEDFGTVLPDRVLHDVLADLPITPQRRGRWPIRWIRLRPAALRIGAAAAVVVVAVSAGLLLVAPPSQMGGPPGPVPTASPTPSPTPSPSPVASAELTAPASLPTPAPLVPSTPLPDPAGTNIPPDLIGRQYRVDPPATQGQQELVLTLRATDDPHCAAMFGGRSTCFTILWTPNWPKHISDPGVRGPARLVGGDLVLRFSLVPFDPDCDGTSSTYAVGDGTSLHGIDVPACSFMAFVEQ